MKLSYIKNRMSKFPEIVKFATVFWKISVEFFKSVVDNKLVAALSGMIPHLVWMFIQTG